jgi:L-aspartate oxidase
MASAMKATTRNSHIADTLDAGAGLCKEAAVRAIVHEGAAAIRDLVDYGVGSTARVSHFLLGKEGGHSPPADSPRADTTGREVARALIETARRTPNLTLLETIS